MSHAMPREPIKRNYDYSGNYLDRIRRLTKKRKRRSKGSLVKRLRVIAGHLKKRAVKEYFSEEEILEILDDGLPDLKVEKMPGEKRDFAGCPEEELPFAYGEIPNYINPADDMGWDVILLPSTLGSSRSELAPVGILRYSRDVSFWETLPGEDPIGNDKVLLGRRNPSGEGICTNMDKRILEEFLEDKKSFEKPEYFDTSK